MKNKTASHCPSPLQPVNTFPAHSRSDVPPLPPPPCIASDISLAGGVGGVGQVEDGVERAQLVGCQGVHLKHGHRGRRRRCMCEKESLYPRGAMEEQ